MKIKKDRVLSWIQTCHLWEFLLCTAHEKLANLLAIKIQHCLRCNQVVEMPIKYFINLINVLNLCCPLCPTGCMVSGRRPACMHLPDLKRVVSEVRNCWDCDYLWRNMVINCDGQPNYMEY